MSQNFKILFKGESITCPYAKGILLDKNYLAGQFSICKTCIEDKKKIALAWENHQRNIFVMDSLYKDRINACESSKSKIETECQLVVKISNETIDSLSGKLQRSLVYLQDTKEHHQLQIDGLKQEHKKKTLVLILSSIGACIITGTIVYLIPK